MNSTASGSERGLLKQPLDGATLATARGTDPAIPYTRLKTALIDPIRDEHVGVTLLSPVAVRAEDELLAVGRKHREAVEGVVERDAFKPRAVNIDCVELEIAPALVIEVRREDDPLAVGEEVRGEAGFVELGHAALVRAVGVHHPDVSFGGVDKFLLERGKIVDFFFSARGVIRGLAVFLAVVAQNGPAVKTNSSGQPLHIPAILVHRVDVQIAVAQTGEDDR